MPRQRTKVAIIGQLFTMNNNKGEQWILSKFVLTDDTMTGGSGEGSNSKGKTGDGQLCTDDGGPEGSAAIVMLIEESKTQGNVAGNYTMPMDENNIKNTHKGGQCFRPSSCLI